MEVGCGWVGVRVGPDITVNVFVLENHPKIVLPALTLWGRITCVCCVYMILNVVNYIMV